MAKTLKCLVWDLDDTLWDGILLEGGARTLRPGARETIVALDRRGILLSIASRNVVDETLVRLKAFALEEYFLYPQIGFGAKSEALTEIAKALNIALDTFAFIDDQPFERDEVLAAHPEVRVYAAEDVARLPTLPEFTPRFVNPDSALRRAMYQADFRRKAEEDTFSGPQESFLRGLNMRFSIGRVEDGDLERAVDLTERTNQLNATGLTFDHDELDALRRSPRHLLHISSLQDKYGDYGRIGLSLVEKREEYWVIKLLLMSCRVMNRGVGSVQLNHLIREALAAGKKLRADFVETPRNRMMYVTYKFAGFEEVAAGEGTTLEYKGAAPPSFPDYLEVVVS
ncbi:MAG: HAD-IIIC family phosphatase [Candidatus Accumulibacter sp.]|jgi:FkbH-like protein|nr:HAD-IIIC family phosphatase [Accumulibacter sp.]